jgi:hypothetical protein
MTFSSMTFSSMTFSVFMTISFDNANLVRPLLFAKATPNLCARAANAMSDARFFVPSMSIQKVMSKGGDALELDSRVSTPSDVLRVRLENPGVASPPYTALSESEQPRVHDPKRLNRHRRASRMTRWILAQSASLEGSSRPR